MPATSKTCQSDSRFVGDPIDVVTGANTDAAVDLRQRGPIPFQWVRYYSSARAKTLCLLGWGQSHGFDRLLHRDLEGLRYEDPLGGAVGFPDLSIADNASAGGMMLTRVGENSFVVYQPGQPNQEFEFSHGFDSARLTRLQQGQHTIEFRYAAAGALHQIIDSRGRSIRVIADDAGRIVQLALTDRVTGDVREILLTYEYDTAGNLTRATDVYKTTLTFAYDAANRMIRRTDRRGYSFHFEYDEQDRCVHSRGDDGLFEVFLDYQPEAKITIVRRGDGGVWVYAYNDSEAITQITDPYGNATKYIQDNLGRTVQEIDPNGNVTQLHYNSLGQHDYRIDPNGYVLPTKDIDPNPPDPLAYELPETPIQWEHGALRRGRETRSRPIPGDPAFKDFPPAVLNTFLESNARHVPGQKDWRRNPTTEEDQILPTEDERGRPMEQGLPGHMQRWIYDPNGNLAEHHDRDGAVYRYIYTSWNALHQKIDPLGHATVFSQSSQGFVNRVQDPGGTVTEYVYDLKDRLIEVRCDGIVRERYAYDAAASIVEKTDGQGRTLVIWEVGPATLDVVRRLSSGEVHTFKYDERGRIIAAVTPDGTATFAFADDGGRLADKRDGIGVAHEFEQGQLVTTTCFDKFRTSYWTDNNGDVVITDTTGTRHRVMVSGGGVIVKHLTNGARELCFYDGLGRCRRKALCRNSHYGTTWMRSYTYSRAGDLLSIIDTMQGTVHYNYDKAHRLSEETLPDGSRHGFFYDPAGNLLCQPGLTDVVMGSGNHLRAANGDRFTYNYRDHLSTREGPRGTTRYEYNALDMLVQCEINGEIWTASYDALCRRIRKTWRGQTTTYYWDDFRLAAEVRHDSSLRVYVYEDNVALVPFMFVEYAGLDAEPASGKRYYIFTNQIGVPIRVEDDGGRSCWSARIDPYGLAHLRPDSTLEMPLRFPGHYHDPEIGLHYNRFRYFSPELGRYLQSDPAGLEGGINLYGYPTDPLTDADIDGLAKAAAKPAKSRASGKKAKGTPEGADAGCPLHERKGWVAPYGVQKGVTGDGSADRDHQPSKLAIKKAIKEDIDKRVAAGEMDPPSKAQMKEINARIDRQATAVVVDGKVHRAGDTHGSQNKEQSEIDKKDLGKAAAKDADNMVAATKKLDPENEDAAKAAAKKIKEQSHESIMEKNRQIVDDVMDGK